MVCRRLWDRSSRSRPLSVASAELGTRSSWLLGSPSAWSGDASPSNATSETDLISPDDTTNPCSDTPSNILPGSELTFCTVQSKSDMDDVSDRFLSARATVSNVDLPPVHLNVWGRSHAHDTFRTSGHFHWPPLTFVCWRSSPCCCWPPTCCSTASTATIIVFANILFCVLSTY